MLRSFLIYLSKAAWAQRLVMGWGLAWRAASRFIAGTEVEDAVRAIRELNARGINVTLDHLGEHTNTASEASEATLAIITNSRGHQEVGTLRKRFDQVVPDWACPGRTSVPPESGAHSSQGEGTWQFCAGRYGRHPVHGPDNRLGPADAKKRLQECGDRACNPTSIEPRRTRACFWSTRRRFGS